MLFSLAAVVTLTALLGQPETPQASSVATRYMSSRAHDRVIKMFDFDERKLGNFEDMPMNWNKLTGPGYPWFLEPRFDHAFGHTAPPSLRLAIQGGGVGADYVAKDISVRPTGAYRISAWVHTKGLRNASAFISAYFLDHALQRISASEIRSDAVGGRDADGRWTLVTVDLHGGFERAAWIGLSCRVEQPPDVRADSGRPRPIQYRDVHGVAWVDDITVLRLPKARLEMGAPGNVFLAGQPTSCKAQVEDRDGAGLTATLDILDADGSVVERHGVAITGPGEQATPATLGELVAGLYTARLTVRAGSQEILVRRQVFLRLNPDVARPAAGSQGFGLILDPSAASDGAVSRHLLSAVSPDKVKIPFWRRDTDDRAIVRGDPVLSGLLHTLRDLKLTVVATLDDPPASLAEQKGKPDRTLLDVLSSDPVSWRPYLALLLTRYGSYIWAWQVGADGDEALMKDRRVPAAVANVRAELLPLIGSPDLVVPISIQASPRAGALPADIVSVTVPSHLSADQLPAHLAAFDGPDAPRRWATVRPPDADRYTRRSRLIEFARCIVVARHSGIDTVFAEQPWSVRRRGDAIVVTPTEELFVLRTLAQSLGGSAPAGRTWIDHDLRASLFVHEKTHEGALVIWTEGHGAEPRDVILDVGPDARRIDMWANVTEPAAAEGGRRFRVGAMPVVIAPVPAWRARMLSAFGLDDPTLQIAVEEHVRQLTLANPADSELRGTLWLKAPRGWRVRPNKINVDIPPGGATRIEVGFRIPNNQTIGDEVLAGRLLIEDEDHGQVILRAPLHVTSPGLDVNVMTGLTGRRLEIVQRITNLTNESLNLRTFLIAPNVPFDARTVSNLAPNQTAVRTYHVEDARPLAGRHIRISTQQVGGALRHNQVIKLDP